jgi:Skp family chaperone for outer membrane proteins
MRRFLLTTNVLALLALTVAMIAAAGFGWKPLQAEAAPPQPDAPATSKPRVAAFNISSVMKEYEKARYQVYMLNEERKKLSVDLVSLKGKHLKNQNDLQFVQDAKIKEQMQKKQVELARQIEDKEREINKQLNEKSEAIISSLYDDIKLVVDKTAELNGYDIVFAYPDAMTADEAKDVHIKELKLKPPAAQPFFVAKHVDLTSVVIMTLNAWYPPPSVPEGEAPPPIPMDLPFFPIPMAGK